MLGSGNKTGNIGVKTQRTGSIGKNRGRHTGDALSTGVNGNFSRVHWPTTTSTTNSTTTTTAP